ncbi:MAG: hypothetical protein R3250_11190 [Melioribacteraceae bacterium]|nr:hypothetical protein [Melioribacteraceae bacterium]
MDNLNGAMGNTNPNIEKYNKLFDIFQKYLVKAYKEDNIDNFIKGLKHLTKVYPELELCIQPEFDPVQYPIKEYNKKWSLKDVTIANLRLNIGNLNLGRPMLSENRDDVIEIVFLENKITDIYWDIPEANHEQIKHSFLQSVFTHLYVIMGSIGNIDEYRVLNLEKALIQLM